MRRLGFWSRVAVAGCGGGLLSGSACSLLTGVGDLRESSCASQQCDAAREGGEETEPGDVEDPRDVRDSGEAEVFFDGGAEADASLPDDALEESPGPDADSGAKGNPYAYAVAIDGPLAYWRFNEKTGTLVHDSSGNGNSGTFVNCTLGAPDALLDVIETSVSFDGVSSSVTGPSFPFAGVLPLTIEAWVNATTMPSAGYHQLLSNETQTGDRQGYAVLLTAEGALWFERFVDDVNTGYIVAGSTLSIGVFHHVVGTYDGATLALYYDGVLDGTVPDTRVSVGTTDPFYVGSGETTKYFEGNLGEVAIYDHALSAARVAAHFAASGR